MGDDDMKEYTAKEMKLLQANPILLKLQKISFILQ